MSEEKRMADAYEIWHAIHIGDKEVVLGIDATNAQHPYMVCYCTLNNIFGTDYFFDAVAGDDYLEMMTEFVNRVSAQIEAVNAERKLVPVSLQLFGKEHCTPNDYSQSIEHMVVALRPERLRPEYRTAIEQLVLVRNGFGAQAGARGRAVFIVNVYSGKEERWNREDILGVVKPEHIPDWVKERLARIRAEKGIEYRNQEIEDSRQEQHSGEEATKPAEKKKHVPER